jgi:hypothetical protein
VTHVSDAAEVDIPDAALRSALEFAVGIAAAGQKLTPKLPVPAALRPFLKTGTLPGNALGKVRAAIEADDVFRQRLGIGVQPELVDEVGSLWLRRPDGWEQQVRSLLEQTEPTGDLAVELRREQRRRVAAEAATERSRRELERVQGELTRAEADLADQRSGARQRRSTVDDLRRQVAELERRAERADRERDAMADQHEGLLTRIASLEAQLSEAVAARDHALGRRSGSGVDVVALVQRLHEQQRRAQATADELLATVSPGQQRRRRMAIPGRIAGDARAEAEYLLRSDAEVLVDGYNVAKLQWPDVALVEQRDRCIALAEDRARRFGADITVVFDGADVVGATGTRRVVSVLYSPAGVTADDVIRERVGAIPAATAVVVVTNDQAIIADVRAAGAHTIASEVFAALR